MANKPLISLCIPTNGIIELIFPVLDSIYSQNVDESLFETVVMDNGNNEEFKKMMKEYALKHSNIVYKETKSSGFLNEIDSYKAASGEFIKFINHRTKLCPGTLNEFLSFVQKNQVDKPCVYFSNGVLKLKGTKICNDFNEYVCTLIHYSSWSTGMGFWKEDFDRIRDFSNFNELFPHTNILFSERKKNKYIIDNRILLDEIEVSQKNKGRYDLFYAFAVEYLNIINQLVEDGSITKKTFNVVKKSNLKFITQLYYDFVIRKNGCSYDLTSFKTSTKIYYSPSKIKFKAYLYGLKRMLGKLAFWK